MLDIDFIRKNPDVVQSSINLKNLPAKVTVSDILELDSLYRDKLQLVELKRSLRNKLSEDVALVKDADKRQDLIDEARVVKEDLQTLEKELDEVKVHLDGLLLGVPNIIHADVPVGKDESENVVLRTWGNVPEFDFSPRDHVYIGEALDLIDTETSAEVSGTRFCYLKNEAVLLQFGLVQFVLKTLTDPAVISKLAAQVGSSHADVFMPVVPPVIIRADVARKMDRLDPVEDRYYYEEDDVMFVGSAEHSLGPMHMNTVFDPEDLPKRYIGYSTAFRREAGTYGKDTQGILRVHQFDKLEMESFTSAEDGLTEQDLFVAIQEYLLQQLKIPYQVVAICTGDMGKPDYRQIDIECYLPGQGKYRETHTSDYMTDFQARRLNTRYRDSSGEMQFVHMNDATAFAIGRTLIALLENYQQSDGSVIIPEVLRPFLNGQEKITSRRKL